MGVKDQVRQAPPLTSHLHTQALSPPDYLYSWNVTSLAGKQRPLSCTKPAATPSHPGLPRGPTRRYQTSRPKDKEPQLGPTNGIILGTTQDRMGWGPGPSVSLSFISTLNEGQIKDQHLTKGWKTTPPKALGRNLPRVTIPSPSRPLWATRPPTGEVRCQVEGQERC